MKIGRLYFILILTIAGISLACVLRPEAIKLWIGLGLIPIFGITAAIIAGIKAVDYDSEVNLFVPELMIDPEALEEPTGEPPARQ